MKLKYYSKLRYLMYKSKRKKIADLLELYKKYRSKLQVIDDEGNDVTKQIIMKSVLMAMTDKTQIDFSTINYILRKTKI